MRRSLLWSKTPATRPRCSSRAFILFLFSLSIVCLGDSGPTPSPFTKLDSDLRRYIAIEKAALASQKREAHARQTLEILYYYLNDIRNHRAFWSLWSALDWKKDTINVLYPGSGSHLAPLVFLYGPNRLREASYTFTEIDQSAPVRIEALLRTMERGGMCSGVTVAMAPMKHTGFDESWAEALSSKDAKALRSYPEIFISWYLSAVRRFHVSPGFSADFTFRVRETRARIHMLVSVPRDEAPGSTAYYQQSDFNGADLVISHDWDSSPRTNLEVLYDLLNSSRIAQRKAPLFVMMEDLRRYPFPVDLAPFHPLAVSATPYGHRERVYLPDGSRLDSEDGPSLYGGGVLLKPDIQRFNPLNPQQLETFFNLLLFSGYLYDRGNVDVLDNCLVTAPPLLDLGVGYGYRDILGRDRRGDGEFPSKLAEGAIHLLQSPLADSPQIKADLCRLISQYRATLESKSKRDVKVLLDEWTQDQSEHPFLKDPATRKKFAEIYADRTSVAAQVERDCSAFREALGVFEKNRALISENCGK